MCEALSLSLSFSPTSLRLVVYSTLSVCLRGFLWVLASISPLSIRFHWLSLSSPSLSLPLSEMIIKQHICTEGGGGGGGEQESRRELGGDWGAREKGSL